MVGGDGCDAAWSETSKSGLLFHQDHVVRYSALMGRVVRSACRAAYVGPGEVFASHVCASQLFLDNSARQRCTLRDIAPIKTRGETGNWGSPQFCWDEEVGSAVDLKSEICVGAA